LSTQVAAMIRDVDYLQRMTYLFNINLLVEVWDQEITTKLLSLSTVWSFTAGERTNNKRPVL
jgi:hypothetical protein